MDYKQLIDIEYNTQNRIRFHEKYSTNSENWFNWIYDRMMSDYNTGTVCKVLEVGGGTGEMWVRNTINSPIEVVLSDVSQELIELAKNRVPDNVDCKVVDTHLIKYSDGFFDKVLANIMLYHCNDMDKSLSEIKRVLNETGKFYATTAGKTHMSDLKKILTNFDKAIIFPYNGTSSKFSRENGAEVLSKHFTKIELIDFDNDLIILPDDHADLVSYIISFKANKNYHIESIVENIDEFRQYINSLGKIKINKSNCLFVATK